jgi:2-oxoisovalerate dehydrogenase E1 component beta subunit
VAVDKDPLLRLRQYLLDQGVLPEWAFVDLAGEVDTQIERALSAAEAAVSPAPVTAFERVFAQPRGAVNGPRPEGGPERSLLDALRGAQHDLLAADERVVVLGTEVTGGGTFCATEGLRDEFGDHRVMDTQLSESSIVGIGIGLALADMRPIVDIGFADSLHSAFDQIVNEAARLHYRSNGNFPVPLVIRCAWGGGVRAGLDHSQSVEAFYAHVPGLKVVAPSTPADVAGLLRAAVADIDPVLFLEHKQTYRLVTGPVPTGDWTVPIGAAAVARAGDDLTIVTYGLHRHLAVEAADRLAHDDGVSIEVVDLRTISPLDTGTILGSAAKTGRVLVVHEDNISFGVGSEVAALVADEAFYDLDAPVRRLAMPDVPAMPFAAPLEAAVMVGTGALVQAARDLLAV